MNNPQQLQISNSSFVTVIFQLVSKHLTVMSSPSLPLEEIFWQYEHAVHEHCTEQLTHKEMCYYIKKRFLELHFSL